MKEIFNIFLFFAKRHYVSLLFAFTVGILCVAPHFLAVKDLGNEYKGIPFFYLNNEHYYEARIQEIADGHISASSPYYFEYKDAPSMILPIGEFFYYIPHVVAGISVTKIIILAKFLFPAILFLLVYGLVFNLSGIFDEKLRMFIAISAGLFSTIGYDLVDFRQVINLIGGSGETTLSLWTRPVNPITGGLFLFSLLNLLWIIWNKNGKYIWILSGILFGLSIGYFFSFALSAAIIFVLILFSLIRKKYNTTFLLAGVFLIGIVLNFNYWYQMIIAMGDGSQAGKNGMLFFHTPIFNKVLLATILVLILAVSFVSYKRLMPKDKEADWLWFVGALIVGGVIVFNQQVITGQTIWPYHFVQYTIPISIISSFILIAWVLRNFGKIMFGIFLIFIILPLLYGGFAVTTYRFSMSDFREVQKYSDVFNWLNINAENDCVILVVEDGERLGRMIPAFTSCNVYRTDDFSPTASEERLYHNVLVLMRLKNVAVADAEKYLNEHESKLRSYFAYDWNQVFAKEKDPRIEPFIRELAKRYKEFNQNDFRKELSKYKLDYVVLAGADNFYVGNKISGLEFLRDFDDMKVHKF